MAEIKVNVPPELEKRFRKTARSLYGGDGKAEDKAAFEAFLAWCGNAEKLSDVSAGVGDPVSAIEGLLIGVHKTGVQLQHEASRHRAESHSD